MHINGTESTREPGRPLPPEEEKQGKQYIASIRKQAEVAMRRIAGVTDSSRISYVRRVLEDELLNARLLEQQTCGDKILTWNSTTRGHENPLPQDLLELLYFHILSPLELVESMERNSE